MTVAFEGLGDEVAGVWEALFGVSATPAPASGFVPSDPMLVGSVHITGPFSYMIVTECSARDAANAAASMFEMDVEDLDAKLIRDAFGEVVNVVGGHLKNVLGGVSKLSVPTVVEGSRLTCQLKRARFLDSCSVNSPFGQARVTVYEDADDFRAGGAAEEPGAAQGNQVVSGWELHPSHSVPMGRTLEGSMTVAFDGMGDEVAGVWEAMFGISGEAMDPEAYAPSDPTLVGTVFISGPFNFMIVTECSTNGAAAAAAAMFEMEPSDLEPEQVRDAFGEIVNIVGGHIKNKLGGVSKLSVPSVVEGSNVTYQLKRVRRVEWCAFKTDTGDVRVAVYEDADDAPQGNQ